ncbi:MULTISPECIES: type II toxin-antitoxin system RelE/ParE family toxin [Stenotrophomonas]|uniref:type II toxin-antitoxin system RelE/ParE family toxin n=1 Tax=Stenotrophomonas TaxID=40323 RepID=UPI0013D946AC|nr:MULTISPECIES: type II toxin-antitoxin system RelE/ParE family toxin [Stenotrophomonas]
MKTKRTLEFVKWIDGLQDIVGRARIQARIERLAAGNPGDHRNLSGGISELRVDVGPGYRVYYTQRGKELIILLVGGDKSSKAAQQRDIKKAQELAANL